MTAEEPPDKKGILPYPPLSKDFDPFTTTEEDLKRHRLPLWPNPQTQCMATLRSGGRTATAASTISSRNPIPPRRRRRSPAALWVRTHRVVRLQPRQPLGTFHRLVRHLYGAKLLTSGLSAATTRKAVFSSSPVFSCRDR
jgi:hypothetical protein